MTTHCKIPRSNISKCQRWLEVNVSPKKYHLHTQIGGSGWAMKQLAQKEIEVIVEDDEKATLLILKFT